MSSDSSSKKDIRSLSETASVDELSTAPFPASKKIYVQGSRPDISVAMREISLSSTKLQDGEEEFVISKSDRPAGKFHFAECKWKCETEIDK